jgi:hypothetical protein
MYPVDPMQLIQMIKQGQNPEQLLLSILEGQAGSNPMSANLLSLAKNKDAKGLEQIARNIFAQRGLDFDTEFNALKQMLNQR